MDLSEFALPCRLDRMTGMVALTDAAPSSPMRMTWQMSDLEATSDTWSFITTCGDINPDVGTEKFFQVCDSRTSQNKYRAATWQ